MVTASETTLAWLAALIDGEGSIMLGRRTYSGNSKQQTNPSKRPHYRAIITISNTDLRLLNAVVKRTGITTIYKHVRKPKENHKKTSYTWRLNATQIREWGPQLLPWLICKKEQMELVLESLRIKEEMTARKGERGVPLDRRIELTNRLDEIYAEVRILNTKGREPEGGDA